MWCGSKQTNNNNKKAGRCSKTVVCESERDRLKAGFPGPECCAQGWVHRPRVKRLQRGGAQSGLGRGAVVSEEMAGAQTALKPQPAAFGATQSTQENELRL